MDHFPLAGPVQHLTFRMSDLYRILAIDYGAKRTGLAISDPLRMLARPYDTLRGASDDEIVERVLAAVREEGVGAVVLGLPLGLEGHDTPQTEITRAFAEKLAARLNIPIHLQDERYTSHDANDILKSKGMSPRESRNHIDATAAAVLLRQWLKEQE